MFQDLKSHRWMIAKGFLFLLAGCMAGGLLLAESPQLRTAALLGVAVWSFARFYYFAFYVLERYIDDEYRYAGLFSAMRFAIQRFAEPSSTQSERDHD